MKKAPSGTSARNKLMDYLARRDHSELELRQKLKRFYSVEEIETAINYGKEQGWIPNDLPGTTALANKTAEALHRRKKGILFINSYLRKKGLPEVQSDRELELEKAEDLVKNKNLFSATQAKDLKAKRQQLGKIGRFLSSRGFESRTIQQIIAKGWK